MRNMGVGIFGPLDIEGVSLSPRERTLLSALVLRAGRPVTTDELAEALWGDEPPATWTKQLQASIGRVRAAIGRNAVVTTPGGYAVRIDPETVDAERFERFAASAREHLRDDPARAVDAAERALALWRGIPYADLSAWAPAIVESERLEELRRDTEEVRLDARLQLGEHASCVGDAERLVREAPLSERRWVLLATALYRSGRQADALAAIRSARERLADELGADPGTELADLEIAVLRHDDSLDLGDAPSASSIVCPYRGLQPFGVDDEDEFFGRDADIRSALARLARSTFLAISGASGSGKSSLVRAGVVPALRRRGDHVTLLSPERELDVGIRDAAEGAGRADVVVIDQFEEVFHAGEADVDAAAQAIADAAAAGTTVIVVVRSDFLDECAAHPVLAPLVAEGVHLVGPMSTEALRDAIEQPARRAALRLEPGLVELILRDVGGEAGALPHMSHALVETWLRREGATMTVAGYEASGGISGAIAQSADRLYQSMDLEQRVICRWIMQRLVTLASDGSPVRRRVPSKSLQSDAAREQVLTMLSRARLVRAEAAAVEVAHESLATAWPRLQSWLEEDGESARLLTAVAVAAEAWNAAGRPGDDLYRGARLQAALEWRDASPRGLTDVESAFLDAASTRASAEQTLLSERARRDRRQNRRLRTLLAVAGGLIMLLAGAGSVAVLSSREATAQRDSAAIEALVGTALALRMSERDVSALLAAEAYRRWPDEPRTRSGLMGVLQGAGGFMGNAVVASSGTAYGRLIPGTEDALVVTTERGAAIRDTVTGEVRRELELGFDPGPVGPRPLVAISRDGRIGAVLWPAETQFSGVTWYGTSPQSDLVVFDLERGERIVGPTRIQAGTGALAVDGTGANVAIADARDGAVTLVSPMDGRTRPVAGETTTRLDRDTYAAALAFDGRDRLLVGRLDDRVEVVDAESATVLTSMAVPAGSAHVAMATDESGVVVASGDRSLIAFDADGGRLRWTTDIIQPYLAPCTWLAISEVLQRVYCGNLFGRIAVYDLADGTPLPDEELGPLYGAVGTIDVRADGSGLTTISASNPVVSRWQLDGSGPGRRLVAPGEMVVGPYAFEGSLVLTAPQAAVSEDGDLSDVSVLDTETGELVYRFDGPVSNPGWAQGRRLYARHSDGSLFRIIDLATGEQVGDDLWNIIRFWPSPDGARLHAARTDGRLQEFDPATGRPEGDSWRVEGFPLWLSVSPDGERLAVTHWITGPSFGLEDATLSARRDTRLAIVAADDHRVMSDRPFGASAHVLLADGDLIAMEGNRMGRFETDPFSRTGTVPGAAGGLMEPTISRDANTMLVLAADGSALLYDASRGERIGDPVRTDSRTLAPSVLRPDGLEMAVSMPEGVVVWDIDPEHQFEQVCRIAGRDLSDTEWRTYLGDLDDRHSTCGFG